MSKIKVLLTGGGGFIGKNILEQLGDKYDLLAPNSQDLDLLDSEAVKIYLKKEKPDQILHLASRGVSRGQAVTLDIAENNLRMFFNLVRNKEYFNRLIVIGSGAEYDKTQSIVRAREEEFDQRVPRDQYGFSKYVMSKYAEKSDYITHLRFFGVYGKYEDYPTRFISNMICRALYGLPLKINQNAVFDYMCVDDLVKIIDLFIAKKPKEIFYNVGSGQEIELLSIAEKIKTLINPELRIEVSNPNLNKEYTCCYDKLISEFGEYDYTNLETGIRKLIEYYRENLDKIDPLLL